MRAGKGGLGLEVERGWQCQVADTLAWELCFHLNC